MEKCEHIWVEDSEYPAHWCKKCGRWSKEDYSKFLRLVYDGNGTYLAKFVG